MNQQTLINEAAHFLEVASSFQGNEHLDEAVFELGKLRDFLNSNIPKETLFEPETTRTDGVV